MKSRLLTEWSESTARKSLPETGEEVSRKLAVHYVSPCFIETTANFSDPAVHTSTCSSLFLEIKHTLIGGEYFTSTRTIPRSRVSNCDLIRH